MEIGWCTFRSSLTLQCSTKWVPGSHYLYVGLSRKPCFAVLLAVYFAFFLHSGNCLLLS